MRGRAEAQTAFSGWCCDFLHQEACTLWHGELLGCVLPAANADLPVQPLQGHNGNIINYANYSMRCRVAGLHEEAAYHAEPLSKFRCSDSTVQVLPYSFVKSLTAIVQGKAPRRLAEDRAELCFSTSQRNTYTLQAAW
jgi:hypothetical protein